MYSLDVDIMRIVGVTVQIATLEVELAQGFLDSSADQDAHGKLDSSSEFRI